MSFLIVGVGQGIFNKDQLIEQLAQWGIENPLSVVKAAEKGKTICGKYRILGLR
jgi:hypothetical protein